MLEEVQDRAAATQSDARPDSIELRVEYWGWPKAHDLALGDIVAQEPLLMFGRIL
jgi:hypothetical protein